jgi:ring-1,2-phenylacetyl-CoA epoxidase subunit PaaB
MQSPSLDPRVNRVVFADPNTAFEPETNLEQWQTYEVFQQITRGTHHQHVGSVHAPDPEIALVFAKEQYARRMKCVNLWVVKTADIFCSDYEDEDMFDPALDKSYREAHGYHTREILSQYKRAHGDLTPLTQEEQIDDFIPVNPTIENKTPNTTESNTENNNAPPQRRIIVRKKK